MFEERFIFSYIFLANVKLINIMEFKPKSNKLIIILIKSTLCSAFLTFV